MEEKMSKQLRWLVGGLLIVLFIIGSFNVFLSKNPPAEKSQVPSVDPEQGLQNWIEAVNGRNIDRIYDLSPDDIKQQRTLVQFREDNINNTILRPGYYFLNYSVINKKQNGTYAQIIAQVFLHQPENSGSLGPEVPLQYKFALYYQHGEWKIWTLKWT